jgi:hypothetical protein
MPARQTAPCITCRRTIEISDAGATITMMLRLVGMPDLPRLYESLGIPDPPKSESGQVYMCAECCVEDAMGKIPPPTHPFSVLAHELLSRMTGKNPSVIFSAWQGLRERIDLPPTNFSRALSEGEVLPPTKRLKEAS